MKKIIFFFAILLFSMPFEVAAQDSADAVEQVQEVAQDTAVVIVPPPGGTPTVDWLFSQANAIYMVLLYLLGWASGFIPVLKKLDDKRLRMLILGLILAGAFTVWQLFQKDLNWQDFAGLVMAFVATQLGYQYILSPIPALKTPEPEKKKQGQ